MDILEQLRTWNERHRSEAIPSDVEEAAVITANQAGLPLTSIDRNTLARTRNRVRVPDNSAAVARLTRSDGPGRAEPMRDAQERLVHVLLRQLAEVDTDASAEERTQFDDAKETLSKVECSAWIDRLREKIHNAKTNPAPVKADNGGRRPSQVWGEMRSLAAPLVDMGGRYGARFAIDNEDKSVNDVSFWWVSSYPSAYGTRYKLRQILGGNAVPVRMSPEGLIGVLKKIHEAGPLDAMLRFGRLIGSCGHCGTALTNQESRARGIGPYCAKKH